jgi:hypothetical protein
MTISVTTTLKMTGPMFDGSAARILAEGITDAGERLMDDAKREVEQGTGQFKNPTGRYRGGIHTEITATRFKVLPGRLPYVAWLEGTSRRNQTTRFKGYGVFRDARLRFATYAHARFAQYLQPTLDRLR